MTHCYLPFVQAFAQLQEQGRALPLGELPAMAKPVLATDAPHALLFAPHPDDESIGGALPLRLLRELGHRVTAVAVTQGSNPERQAERRLEMRAACGHLGFHLATLGERGLAGITPKARIDQPELWAGQVATIAALLLEHQPRTLFVPHAGDGHPAHQGTHLPVMDALAKLGPALTCLVVETEFWAPLADPDLLVEVAPADVAELMAALSCHRQEVLRNPYHLRLPSWLSDNVRRGGELVGGQGGDVPACAFANLFRLWRWDGQQLLRPLHAGVFVPAGPDSGLAALFGQ